MLLYKDLNFYLMLISILARLYVHMIILIHQILLQEDELILHSFHQHYPYSEFQFFLYQIIKFFLKLLDHF